MKNIIKIYAVVFMILLSPVYAEDQPNYGFTTLSDGAKIRYGWWPRSVTMDRSTTIILLQGRASFIEKNVEFISKLTDLGFSVMTFDWRGMGGSDRVLPHQQKNHIENFDIYTNDLHQILENVVKPRTKDKLVLLGSSMGGQLALRYMHDHLHNVNGAVLMAPMLDIVTKPFPHWSVGPVVKLMCLLGFSESYAFGYGDHDPNKPDFTKNRETNDPHHFWKTVETVKKWPQYITGGPTFGWVKAALESMAKTRDSEYLQNIPEPILLMIAGNDMTVINTDNASTCALMPRCIHKTYAHAMHNLMKAPDTIRRHVIHDIDAFIKETIEIK